MNKLPTSRPVWIFAFALAAMAGANARLQGEPVISEFMAANSAALADEDGAFSDWIELHNPDAAPIDLTGWFLTDSANNKAKWRLPAVTIPAGGYILVFASNKDRRAPGVQLHTNFALSAGGEYLGLIKPDGSTVAAEFAPAFPAQKTDTSYGLPVQAPGNGTASFLSQPTPGAPNSAAAAGSLSETVAFSQAAGPFRTSFALQLSGASGDQRIRYTITPSITAATAPQPTAASPEYTGSLVIDSSVRVRAAVFSREGTAHGVVSDIYYAKLNDGLGTFSSQLPVFVIDSLGTGPLSRDGIDHPSWLYAWSARGNDAPAFAAAPEVISPLTASVRGSSSAEFPKKGYNVKFTDAAGNKQAQALLDLPAYEKWALVAPWSFDFTYINNSFVYELSNRIGRWAPRTRLVEMFFNADGGDVGPADYAGIYVVTDRIEVNAGRVEIADIAPSDLSGPALTGGYILKFDVQDDDENGWTTTRGIPDDGQSSVVLVTPKAEDAAPAQVDYIKSYVQRMEDALFADRAAGFSQRTYLDYIDRDSWVDHHLLNTFVCNPDAFTRSAYFTKDRGGKLEAGPVWDFDRALGSYWDERSYRYDIWSGFGGLDHWRIGWWGVLAQDPEFMQDWIDRWQSLRENELSGENLASLVDSLAGQVGEEAATRDGVRWPDSVSPYGSYAAQIGKLRDWVVQRGLWIDAQFLRAPESTASAAGLTFTAPPGAQLAYTLDGSDPRSLGGGIAPNALVTPSPLTVPASSNVHVRSYRAELKDAFPGSPWSSAAGGSASSPLTPRARLINISSRAMVGADENALIAGVIVADTAAKRYLSRAVGPGLAAFGASGTVPDPQLSIFAGNGVELFRNNGWGRGRDAARVPGYCKSVGAFPLAPESNDSVLADEFSAGAYTVQVTTPTDRSGIALAELYELDGNGRTVNLSTRARVRTGDGVLIGGFVVQGPAYKRILIRAVGPTLGVFGVSGVLVDPVLTVYFGQEVVGSNDRWQAAQNASAMTAASKNVGAFNLAENSEDAALLVTLPPGAYTVEVKGKNDAEGVALLEIYDVP